MYPPEKRVAVLAAVQSGLSTRKAAALCGVDKSTAWRWSRELDRGETHRLAALDEYIEGAYLEMTRLGLQPTSVPSELLEREDG